MKLVKAIYFLVPVILAGCAGSPLQTGVEAERNRMQIGDVRIGMPQMQVRNILGPAYKRELRVINGHEYEVWYYLTKGTLLFQTRYINENFTPFIFSNNTLSGWGWKYFNKLFEEKEANYSLEQAPETSIPKSVPESSAPMQENPSEATEKNIHVDKQLEETIKKVIEEENTKNTQPESSSTAPAETLTPEPQAQEEMKTISPKAEGKIPSEQVAPEPEMNQIENSKVEETLNNEKNQQENETLKPVETSPSVEMPSSSMSSSPTQETMNSSKAKEEEEKNQQKPSCKTKERRDNYNWCE